jgi:sialic acid synthase SpsE/sugar phosphate isomerase/epimerase
MKSKTYFISEIGKACNGDLAYCEKLLPECKKAGAHAVRFHHFSLEESVHPEILAQSSNVERAWSFSLKLPFLNEVLFSYTDYKTIIEWCKLLELDFIGTPWDIKSFELFNSLGVTHYKINSMNVMNIPLVSKILKTNRKIYISTGGLSELQVKQLCHNLNLSKYDVVLLHAVSAYPAPPTIINMQALERLKKYHNVVGYSSNDLLETSGLAAYALGASVIEKHVHLSDNDVHIHKASINIEKLSKMVTNISEMEVVYGRKMKQESRGEMISQEILSKSLVLKENVVKGTIFNKSNLTMMLPTKGINSKEWFNIVGKKANNNLRKDNYLYSTDVLEYDEQFKLKGKKGLVEEAFTPGKRGVVARLKDIDEMVNGHHVDYVEIHYAASDLKKDDYCKDYDLDLVVHVPEYADGKLLDLCSYNDSFRQLSIQIINQVIKKTRELKRHFKKCQGDVKFIVHPGALTYPVPLKNPERQYALFFDSLKKLDTYGVEILIENMTPFAWFLDSDWAPKQGITNSFLDADHIANFCNDYNYNMCLDLCHAQLYCNHSNKDLFSYMKKVKPLTKHIHFSDCVGIDGEGLQVGAGEIDWQEVCQVFFDYQYGWTPEIWNGHHDNGRKFFEAHTILEQEFEKSLLKSSCEVTEKWD